MIQSCVVLDELTMCRPYNTLAMATIRSISSSSSCCWWLPAFGGVATVASPSVGFLAPSLE